MEKIIHSHTPDGDLWRYKTAEDVLLEELSKAEKEQHDVDELDGVVINELSEHGKD